ncbi:MAG: hypothetical protein MJ105_00125 [Lachnospiraceae bacterium]|nr:hypothetical protein [Lachnospiraceae bacterium]
MAQKKSGAQREHRRKRRARNRAISFVVFLILIVGIGFGGYMGVRFFLKMSSENHVREEQHLEAVLSENAIVSDNSVPESVLPEIPVEEDEVPPEEIEVDLDELSEEERAVRELVASMPLEEKIAGLFVIHPEAITGVDPVVIAGDGTRSALEQNAIGGFWYQPKNVTGAEEIKEMISGTKEMYREIYGRDIMLFVQEEGAMNTIAGTTTGESAIDAAAVIGASGDASNAYNGYLNLARILHNYGMPCDFGINCAVKQTEDCYLGERAFHEDAQIVAEMVNSATRGLNDQMVFACLMDFPGEGRLTADPGVEATYVDATLEQMQETDLLAFQAGIDAKAPMIRMSAAYYKEAFGEDVPATFSESVISNLRNELGFSGVIVSADLSLPSINAKYSAADSAVLALQAGCDIILCPSDYTLAHAAIAAAVANGTITEQRIEESLIRIYMMQQNAGE